MSRRSTPDPAKPRRNPAARILAACVALLAVYYAVLVATGSLGTSTQVDLDKAAAPTGSDLVTLHLKLQEVDVANRVLRATILPAPHGDLVGRKTGEMSRGLRIEVASGGAATSVISYPSKSIIDPTAVELALDRGDVAYPFDRPFVDFSVSAQDDRTGAAVPIALDVESSSRPWVMSATMDEPRTEGAKMVYPVQIDGHRDTLTVTLIMFYLLVILLTTLIAVVTIGSALVQRTLEFSNVIWLSATLLAFPTLRNVMPDAPPLGTALDYVVFFPCVCAIAAMLLWTGLHLVRRESAVLLGRASTEDADDSDTEADAGADADRHAAGDADPDVPGPRRTVSV
ncbi:DUF4436 family protein [Nocardioides sp. SYSU D00065]|uniref:DUF4436 family protein n=1 Tax=Nocardioides sp. SYSU D00065 TaxID=2817378 RepID=UPI001B33B0C2|nr:DUF4436 family protein [Nocardioides sp. SYSU D00065]